MPNAWLSQDRSVLVVSARLPGKVLRDQLRGAGADLAHVFILDVATRDAGASPQDPEHEAFLMNPALLELISLRTARIVRPKAERRAVILVDDVHTFALYNPVPTLIEIARYIGSSLVSSGNEVEFVLSGGEPADVVERLSAALGAPAAVGSDGALPDGLPSSG